MWTPRQTQTRSEYLKQHASDSFKPVVRIPWRVSLAIFAVLATFTIIALLAIIAASS